MACKSIASINFEYDYCANSMGGVKNVWLIDYDKVEGKLGEEADTLTPTIEASAWVHFPMRKNVASFTSTLNVAEEGGSYVSTELNLVLNKMETSKRLAMSAFIQAEAAAIVEDANGIYWFLGKDAPLVASAGTGETGTARGDRNAYTLTIKDESVDYPFEVAKAYGDSIKNAKNA